MLDRIHKDAAEFGDAAGQAVSPAIHPNVFNAAAGIQHNGISVRIQKLQRLQPALGGVRKAHEFLIEDAVEVHEKKRIGP